MPPKRFHPLAEKGYIGEKKSKAKPKPHIESESMIQYRHDRDICYYIQHGGECLWSEEEIEIIRNKYFSGQQNLF